MLTKNNEVRAKNAEIALRAYLGSTPDPDWETDIHSLIGDLLHLAKQKGVENTDELLRMAKDTFEAECRPNNEDEVAEFQRIANALLVKHYGISLNDTDLWNPQTVSEYIRQDFQPFEAINDYAVDKGLARIDQQMLYAATQSNLSAEDEEALLSIERDEEPGLSPR